MLPLLGAQQTLGMFWHLKKFSEILIASQVRMILFSATTCHHNQV